MTRAINKARSFMAVPVLAVMLACAAPVMTAGVPARAQTAPQMSEAAAGYAKSISRQCLRGWESQRCLAALSESALALTANYAAALDKGRKKKFLDGLKNQCAAATAATEGRYPAEAMVSAYTECANAIYDISEASGVSPDLSHYQLLIGGILCLSDDPQCEIVEKGLRRK